MGGGTDSESLKHVAETTSTSDLWKHAKLMHEKEEQIKNNCHDLFTFTYYFPS